MKAVAEFDVDLSRIVPVEAAESQAIVELDAAVGHVKGIQRSGETLPEILSQREIEGGVLRQMVARIGLRRGKRC